MHALIGEIGEAASYLRNDFEFENQYPDIDWFAMAGLRNIIAHDYDAVDMELIWQVVHQDLPKLKKFIEKNFSSKRSWCESGGEFQCPGPEYLQQKAGQKAEGLHKFSAKQIKAYFVPVYDSIPEPRVTNDHHPHH